MSDLAIGSLIICGAFCLISISIKIFIRYKNYRNSIVVREIVQIIKENGPYPDSLHLEEWFIENCPDDIKTEVADIEKFSKKCQYYLLPNNDGTRIWFKFRKQWDFSIDLIQSIEFNLKNFHKIDGDDYYLYIANRAIDNAFLIYCARKRLNIKRPLPAESF